jgi:hypothetical protein
VAHTYNPSYLGGRDQEDKSSKSGWVNSLRDLIMKITPTKKGLPSKFKPQYHPPKKKVKKSSFNTSYHHEKCAQNSDNTYL